MKEQMRTAMLWLACLFTAGCSSVGTPVIRTTSEAKQSLAEPLSAQGQQEMRTIVDSGRLAELQWQDFSDYQKWVKEFYELGKYELAWTRAGKPMEQAVDLVAILEDSAEKRLDSKDYDGERWPGRLSALNSATGRKESELAKKSCSGT